LEHATSSKLPPLLIVQQQIAAIMNLLLLEEATMELVLLTHLPLHQHQIPSHSIKTLVLMHHPNLNQVTPVIATYPLKIHLLAVTALLHPLTQSQMIQINLRVLLMELAIIPLQGFISIPRADCMIKRLTTMYEIQINHKIAAKDSETQMLQRSS
jgi:hypothetical protein